MEDAEAVAAIVAGDPRGIAAAYDRYAVALFSYCRSMLREPEDAADVVQDTFLIATSKLAGLRDPDKLRPWLYAVARNECLRRLRSGEATAALEEAADTPTESAGLGDAAEQEDLRELIKAAIDGLNRGERDVIELSLAHDLEGDELADALGVTRNHAHALLSRARSQLERSLGALVVARTGRQACPELDATLAGWDGQMNVLVRKRVSRHIERCKVCGECKRRELTPALFAVAAPLAVLTPGLRERVLRLCADHTLAGQVHRATVAGRAGSFGHSGFPRPAALTGSSGWHRVLPHSHAMVAGTATAAAAVAVSAVLIVGVPRHAPGPAAGPVGGAAPVVAASAVGTRSSPRDRPSPAHGTRGTAGPGLSPADGTGSAPGAAAQPSSAPGSAGPTASAAAPSSAPESSASASAQASPSAVVQGSLLVSLSQLKLVAVAGLPTGTFTITAQGGPVSSYSITGGSGQVTVSPASGSIASGNSVTITVTATSLIALDTQLTINPGGQVVTVLVTISV
jgi:RNA polymerase sigma factor (sigma-70 family)